MAVRICLLGRQRAGKDAAAEYLVSQWGFRRLALADGVRKVCREIFGVEGRDRALAIAAGNALREVRGSVWVDYILRKLDSIEYAGHRVVISDVRFPNELEAFRKCDFHPLRIVADAAIRSHRPGFDPEWEGHWTETQLDGEKVEEIRNERTIPELHGDLRLIVQRLRLGKYPALPR